MKTTTLFRMVRVGEQLSFDQGRVTIVLQEKSGRTARLRLELHEDVVVDKPGESANDELIEKNLDAMSWRKLNKGADSFSIPDAQQEKLDRKADEKVWQSLHNGRIRP